MGRGLIRSATNNSLLCGVLLTWLYCIISYHAPYFRVKSSTHHALSGAIWASATYSIAHFQAIANHWPVALIKVNSTGRWAHIHVKLLHFSVLSFCFCLFIYLYGHFILLTWSVRVVCNLNRTPCVQHLLRFTRIITHSKWALLQSQIKCRFSWIYVNRWLFASLCCWSHFRPGFRAYNGMDNTHICTQVMLMLFIENKLNTHASVFTKLSMYMYMTKDRVEKNIPLLFTQMSF